MKRNFCIQLAPSTSAARNSRRRSQAVGHQDHVQNGSDFQMWTPIAIVSATVGSLSQFGRLRREVEDQRVTTPHSD